MKCCHPPGEVIEDNTKKYYGWCADAYIVMYGDHEYWVTLFSSYDLANLPENENVLLFQNDNLDIVNFMINQRHNPTAGGPFEGIDWSVQANYLAFQDAIWYFSNDVQLPEGSLAESFALYAVANGDNYIPCEGDYYSIILYPNWVRDKELRAQMIVIEVDP